MAGLPGVPTLHPKTWRRQARSLLSPRWRCRHQSRVLGQLTAVTASRRIPSQTHPPHWGQHRFPVADGPGSVGVRVLDQGSVGPVPTAAFTKNVAVTHPA